MVAASRADNWLEMRPRPSCRTPVAMMQAARDRRRAPAPRGCPSRRTMARASLGPPLVRPRLVDVGGVLAPRSGAAAFAEDGPGDHAASAGRFQPAASRRDAAGVWPTWPCGPP